jgi:hypothetical protein
MIKLANIIESFSDYKLYCDMDGVLVDFKRGYQNLTGERIGAPKIGKEREEFWKGFRVSLTDKNMSETQYWAGLPWMGDGKQLWSYIKKHSPTILSAPSHSDESKIGKRIWIKRELGNIPTILAYDKGKYAHSNGILIDDRKDFIDKWLAGGGIGILHKTTPQTIKELKKLGIF